MGEDLDLSIEALETYHQGICLAVHNGLVFMRENASSRWESKVDLDRLDVSHPHTDVFGQVFGCYFSAARRFGLSTFQLMQIGMYVPFSTAMVLSYGLDVDVYSDLTARWRSVLA